MKQHSLKRWVGACLVGSAVTAGCSYSGPRPVTSGPLSTALTHHDHATILPPVTGQQSPRTGHYVPPTTYVPYVPQPPTPVAEQPVRSIVRPTPVATLPPVPRDIVERLAVMPDEAPVVQAADYHTRPILRQPEAPINRRAYVDITAQPCFDHAPDYSWVAGQVQLSRLNKGWRLRYASVDEVDKYGGSVTLADDGNLQELTDNAYVKIEGALINPDARGIAPLYRVRSIQPIQRLE